MQHYENLLEVIHGSAWVKVVRALLLVNELVDLGQWQGQQDLPLFVDVKEQIEALFNATPASTGGPIELQH